MPDLKHLLARCRLHARDRRTYAHLDARHEVRLLGEIDRLPLLLDRLRCRAALLAH